LSREHSQEILNRSFPAIPSFPQEEILGMLWYFFLLISFSFPSFGQKPMDGPTLCFAFRLFC